MAKYAADTAVSAEASRAEIERTLIRYGADRFLYGWEQGHAAIAFDLDGRRMRFVLPMPDRSAREFTHTPARGMPRSPEAREAAYNQAVRQRWRALLLVIKAKLEAVDAGISTLEEEFLAATVLPDNRTVGAWLLPQLDRAYASGKLPPMLPSPED